MVKVLKIQSQDINMEEVLAQFLLFRKARGIADTTLEEHKYLIGAFIKRCETWEDIPKEIMISWRRISAITWETVAHNLITWANILYIFPTNYCNVKRLPI